MKLKFEIARGYKTNLHLKDSVLICLADLQFQIARGYKTNLPPTDELLIFLRDAVRMSVGEVAAFDDSEAAIVVLRFRRFS